MNSYRNHFDHLGNQIDTAPWTLHDLAVCVFLVGVVSALLSGVLG